MINGVFTKINKASYFTRKKHFSPFGIKCSNVATDAVIQKKYMVQEQQP